MSHRYPDIFAARKLKVTSLRFQGKLAWVHQIPTYHQDFCRVFNKISFTCKKILSQNHSKKDSFLTKPDATKQSFHCFYNFMYSENSKHLTLWIKYRPVIHSIALFKNLKIFLCFRGFLGQKNKRCLRDASTEILPEIRDFQYWIWN